MMASRFAASIIARVRSGGKVRFSGTNAAPLEQCRQHPGIGHLTSIAEHADSFRRPAEGVANAGRPGPGSGVQTPHTCESCLV